MPPSHYGWPPVLGAVLIAALLGPGCVSNRVLSDPQSETATLERINREAGGRTVDVRAQSGQYWRGMELVEVRSDQIVWRDESGKYYDLAVSEAQSLTYRKHTAGLLWGGAIGLALGPVAGGLTYLLDTDGGGSGWLTFSRSENATLTGVATSVLAIPFGLVIGGTNGVEVTYRFEHEAAVASESDFLTPAEGTGETPTQDPRLANRP